MKKSTVKRLNDLNASFYNTISSDFDSSRQYYWQGWEVLYEKHLKTREIRNILDIGCGNARFYPFMKSKGWKGKYLGIEPNKGLADAAERNLDSSGSVEILSWEDYFAKNGGENREKFDLIVAFGVLHHIPTVELRRKFFNEILMNRNGSGLAAISAWCFMENEVYQKKLIDPVVAGFDPAELEDDDYFLPWNRGSHAIRYCHYFSPAEEQYLFNEFKKVRSENFYADGKDGKLNRYIIF